MARIFTKVSITPLTKGNTVIEWQLNPLFNETLPWNFQVQYSHSGVPMLDSDPATDWKPVASVVNTYIATDPSQHVWSQADRWFYRVKLSTGDGHTYYSEPQPAWSGMNQHDRLIVRDILRKEKLLLNKYIGKCGKLLKRRTWGLFCPNNCRDYDTGDVINQNCPVCFGTGFKGGYFPPIDYPVFVQDAGLARIQRNENTGTDFGQTIATKALPCPQPRTNDIWIDADDQRWIVQNIAYHTSYRDFPITLDVELRIVAPTDIIYEIPPNYDGMT
jgi:hypothetical protein